MGITARELSIYATTASGPTIRPSSKHRNWMDNCPGRLPYLCLPMTMANQFGWDIYTQRGFSACWDGGEDQASITITPDEGEGILPVSHFGSGILTFHITYLFVTEAGHNLYIRGPANHGKDGLTPLEGLMETEWLPNVFTMNYRFTRPHHTVRFNRDEPFCNFYPVERHYVESFRPVIRPLSANKSLLSRFKRWCDTRASDKQERYPSGTKARRKDYLQGCEFADAAFPAHQRDMLCHAPVVERSTAPQNE